MLAFAEGSMHLAAVQRCIAILCIGVVMSVVLMGCQPSTETDGSDAEAEPVELLEPSLQAQAHMDKFEDKYVEQRLLLQQRLQAEFVALAAADAPSQAQDAQPSHEETANDTANNVANKKATNSPRPTADDNTPHNEDAYILQYTVLEPQQPEPLTDKQVRDSYQQAMAALYEPAGTALSAADMDTLINIGTLLPQAFEQLEIAQALNSKSPALARLLIQHQVWRQIEAQQSKDIELLKQAQLQAQMQRQQEFEELVEQFNQTIAGYDEQIAKYEKMLKEFD